MGIYKMKKGVLIGLICQFSIMPLLGFVIATYSRFPKEIAARFILVGASPSGLISIVMSNISESNVALSITLTCTTTLLSPVTIPFLMKLLADELITIDFMDMVWSVSKWS